MRIAAIIKEILFPAALLKCTRTIEKQSGDVLEEATRLNMRLGDRMTQDDAGRLWMSANDWRKGNGDP